MFFEDETDLLAFPPLEATWAWRGEALPVMLTGHNARRVFFGSLCLKTGHRVVQVQERQRAENFCDYLDVLRWHYRRPPLLMLLDEDPSHTAAEATGLAEDLDIELVFLPKRAPELNGMDQLFRHGKRTVSANRQYEDVDLHGQAFMKWVTALRPRDALTKAGVFSEAFWLRDCLQRLA